MRKLVFLATAALILVGANVVIHKRERLLADGAVVYLELAPVDPRSLMQGDYMALRFKAVNDAFPRFFERSAAADGHLVVAVEPNGVGTFRRFDNATPLAPGEMRLRYRVRHGEPKLATNAFFFQEGHAQAYQAARYGEFRVAANGTAILTGLRGKDLQPLGPASGSAAIR